MSARPASWWSWHATGAVVGCAFAWTLTRDPWVLVFTVAAALRWSASRHRLAAWLGALVNALFGVVFSALWRVLHHAAR
jgi:hypothetical protein